MILIHNFVGRLRINFPCDCSVILQISYEYNNYSSIETIEFTPIQLERCQKHSNFNFNKINWKTILRNIASKEHISLYELLKNCDHIKINDEIKNFMSP